MKESKNRLNIVVLDACRNNPFAITRGGKGGLSEISDADGMFIAYATDKGKTAEDGDGKNGLFTSYMLKYMDMEGLKIEELFKLVRKEVKDSSNSTQIPWTLNSLYGDFYFTLPKVQNTQVATQSVSQVVKPVVAQEVVVIDGLWYQNQPFTQQDKENYNNKEGGRVWTWDGAKNYCNNLTLGDKSDWRLPTKDELMKLGNIQLYKHEISTKTSWFESDWGDWLDNNRDKIIKNSKGSDHFIRKEFSENIFRSKFWSITKNENDSFEAGSISFNLGAYIWENKSNKYCALCVRGQ